MSEYKEYITTYDTTGSVNISEEVIAAIAAGAVSDVEGVSLYTRQDTIGRKTMARRVRIRIEENNDIIIDIYVAVSMGTVVSEAAKSVQAAVRTAVESATGQSVKAINVHVDAVIRR
ncbi:MAG: Asp23/Gls24 family envelope stress response protein [Oscillospiraceae bacterium]|nr:Asp23/Gls24 family envelope stress response protein [Oscillospiraceae bacterium]